ncbi:MAG: peptidylprolyl isomerase [Deltaproteobacteria bacterium]|nr:peptidylprolyl isomerase [Deltaproteobacteria bacterium]
MTRGRPAMLALLGGSLLLWGCPEDATRAASTPPLATVGERTVAVDDLLVALAGLARQGELPRARGFEALRDRTLHARVVEEVLLTEADTRKLHPSPEAVATELVALQGDPPLPGVAAAAVELFGSESAWRATIARRLAVRAAEEALRAELREGTSVTPEQVAAAVPRYADRLRRPGRLRARQLFDEDPETVRALHARLEDGEDFTALAAELGLPDGGDLGLMSEDAAPTLLVQASAELRPGEHTAVLRSPLGYHVFLLLAKQAGGVASDEEALPLVEQWLMDQAVESRLRAWLAARSDAMSVEVREDVLTRVKCCREGEPYLGAPEES